MKSRTSNGCFQPVHLKVAVGSPRSFLDIMSLIKVFSFFFFLLAQIENLIAKRPNQGFSSMMFKRIVSSESSFYISFNFPFKLCIT